MNVATLTVTCTACPVQMQGETDTGMYWYARFRSRQVQIAVGSEPASDQNIPGNPVAIALGLQPGERFELTTISDDIGVLDLTRWTKTFVSSLP